VECAECGGTVGHKVVVVGVGGVRALMTVGCIVWMGYGNVRYVTSGRGPRCRGWRVESGYVFGLCEVRVWGDDVWRAWLATMD
jgi:hypothetical protein